MSVTLALAGHPPPLVLRASGRVEEVGELGTALALFDDPELHDATFELQPGELLCAFTDGLVEARRGKDLFEVEGVSEVLRRHRDLPVDDVAGALVSAVREFDGERLADDLALLLVRNVGLAETDP
jgi:serine phosphatase RsbU (regulator of sigma subunit)